MKNRRIVLPVAIAAALAHAGCAPAAIEKPPAPKAQADAARPAPPKAAAPKAAKAKPIAQYKPTWESLRQYTVPDWYLDAKFGIFIHWGVYSVPAFGNEWYPRNMYLKRNRTYQHHRQKYGPQKTFGYKDFIPKFTAAKWNPDEWAELFEKSGAKYVVPVAEHHDGFPMYDCSYTKWDAKDMGPKRDIVGELAAALRRRGLKFGASSHRAKNWSYYTYGDELDTSDPKNAGLYGKPHPPKEPPSKEFVEDWYKRTIEIVDKYQPDLMWFDFGFEHKEFEPHRKRFAAHYYNQALQWGRGVAINYKHRAYPTDAAVLDIERGKLHAIRPFFWQTDTSVCFRSWGYIASHQYKPANSIVDDLVDIVSKNGCLLLNIGPRPDGTIPAPQRKILLEIGRWLEVNGEAVYGTRPWLKFGEGPTRGAAGSHSERRSKAYAAQDIRFTRKGTTLYAICLAWPGKEVTIRSLAQGEPFISGKVAGVRLLGSDAKLTWSRDQKGLTVKLPAERPCEHAFALKITGLEFDLSRAIRQGKNGSVVLPADRAELHGALRVEQRSGQPNIGYWDSPTDWASWTFAVGQPGAFEVSAEVASLAGTEFVVKLAGQQLAATAPKTGHWDKYQTVAIGKVTLTKPGEYVLEVRPRDAKTWKPMNLKGLALRKAK